MTRFELFSIWKIVLLGVEQPKLQTHALSVELLSQIEAYSRSVASATNLKRLGRPHFWIAGTFPFKSQKEELSLILLSRLAAIPSS